MSIMWLKKDTKSGKDKQPGRPSKTKTHGFDGNYFPPLLDKISAAQDLKIRVWLS